MFLNCHFNYFFQIGCDANQNNFITIGQCRQTCSIHIHRNPQQNIQPNVDCNLERVIGTCNKAFPRFYFDKEKKECKRFTWEGKIKCSLLISDFFCWLKFY